MTSSCELLAAADAVIIEFDQDPGASRCRGGFARPAASAAYERIVFTLAELAITLASVCYALRGVCHAARRGAGRPTVADRAFHDALAVLSTAVASLVHFRQLRTVGSIGITSNSYLRAAASVLLGLVMLGKRPTGWRWLAWR